MEEKWLVACSGGPDSMALLTMALERNLVGGVAHVNYHVRDQAEDEEAYVKSFCEAHGIPCYCLNEPFSWQGNFEAAARTHRYDFFAKVVSEKELAGVMVAHHEDDLLETYMMQKERNLIPQTYGLAVYSKYQEITVWRPLLHYSKKELMDYCEQKGVRYYIDATNFSDEHRRNVIRHSQVENMPDEQRKLLRMEIEQANARLIRVREKADKLAKDPVILNYRAAEEEVRVTYLRFLLADNSASLAYLRQVDGIIMKHADFEIMVKDKRLVPVEGRIALLDLWQPYADVYESWERIEKEYYCLSDQGKSTEAVTLSADDFPIMVRSVQAGDAILMKFGRKSVHRFFVDRHIPLYQRHTWPVVVNRQGEIVLVPGLGCNIRHFSANPSGYVIELLHISKEQSHVGRKGY